MAQIEADQVDLDTLADRMEADAQDAYALALDCIDWGLYATLTLPGHRSEKSLAALIRRKLMTGYGSAIQESPRWAAVLERHADGRPHAHLTVCWPLWARDPGDNLAAARDKRASWHLEGVTPKKIKAARDERGIPDHKIPDRRERLTEGLTDHVPGNTDVRSYDRSQHGSTYSTKHLAEDETDPEHPDAGAKIIGAENIFAVSRYWLPKLWREVARETPPIAHDLQGKSRLKLFRKRVREGVEALYEKA